MTPRMRAGLAVLTRVCFAFLLVSCRGDPRVVQQGPAEVSIRAFGLVPATINGVGPFWLLLDTGSDRTTLSSAAAARARLSCRRGKSFVSGVSARRIALNECGLGSVGIGQLAAAINLTSQKELPPLSEPFDGYLGADYLSKFLVQCEGDKLRLYASTDENQPARSTASIPFSLNGSMPVLDATVDVGDGVARRLRLGLDSGTGALLLGSHFSDVVKGQAVEGVGSTSNLPMRRGIVASVNIGTQELRNVPVVVLTQPSAELGKQLDGYIGIVLCNYFVTTIDYSSRRLLLETRRHQ